MVIAITRDSILFRFLQGSSLAALVCACGGGDGGGNSAPPAVDVTGVWIGTTTTQDGTTGAIIFDLTQNGAELAGGLELLGDAIPNGNQGNDVTGFVSGHQVNLTLTGVSVRMEGIESAGILTGTFSSGSAKATFSATLAETHVISIPATRATGVQIPRLVAAQGSTLWFFDAYDNCIKETNDSAEVTTTVPAHCEAGFDRCASGFVCSQQGRVIDLVTKPDSSWVVTALSGGVGAESITCDATTIWANRLDNGLDTSSTEYIQQLDMTGSPIGNGFSIPGILHGLTYDGTDLWALESFPKILLRISTSDGRILAAYQIPEARTAGDSLNGLTWDGTALWTLLTNRSHSTLAATLVEASP
jgi:hypothetical protein